MSLDILLVDDHTLFREGLEGLLSRRNINILAAVGSGQEGLRLAAELKPDVVLLDMRMPEMDGMEVLRKLRKSGFTNPVAMLTTSSDERDLVESLRSGAQGYLPRPVRMPCSTAMTAASTREWTPSLRRMDLTCSFTVPSEMPRLRAMTLLL